MGSSEEKAERQAVKQGSYKFKDYNNFIITTC